MFGIPSGPQELVFLSFLIWAFTFCAVMKDFVRRMRTGIGSAAGQVEVSSLVKTSLNRLLSSLAMLASSVTMFPSMSLSGPTLSCAFVFFLT
jgi:hypothetical protein